MKKDHPAHIFVIDDHPVLVAGITTLLEKSGEFSVAGSAETFEAASLSLGREPPDVIVLDINLGTSDGFDALRSLLEKFPDIPVLVFSMHDEAFYAERALQSGAKGYLMKTENPGHILKAIRTLLAGNIYVSERLKSLLFSQLDSSAAPQVTNPIKKLTNRELQVIQLIGKGKNNREIAGVMNIRLKTVEAHRFRIKEKLNLKHSTELIQFAIHWVQRETNFRSDVSA